ncbi:MAG: hypothetical protein WC775_03800 [Patescibacteria group bacterium]|jgi:hypothetical protein
MSPVPKQIHLLSRLFFSCFGLILVGVCATVPVSAQTTPAKPSQTLVSPSVTPTIPPLPESGINLTISPIFLNLVTDPGKSVTSQLRITNNSNQTEYLKIDIAKFDASQGGGNPRILDITPDDEFAKWVDFSIDKFTLDPNETKTVKFTISPDLQAAFGYYYALIVNRVEEAEGKKGTTVVTGAPAFLVLLEVKSPHAKRELQLVDFSTSNLWYEYLPVKFLVSIKNTGNVHVIPVGDIFIDQGSTRDVDIVRVNSVRGNILPNSSRIYEASWEDGFPAQVPKLENGTVVRDENSNLIYETKWDFAKADRFRIGKYTAHLLLVYDNGRRDIPVEAVVSFWIIPWKIIGIFVVVLYFVFIGIRSTLLAQIRRVRDIIKKK